MAKLPTSFGNTGAGVFPGEPCGAAIWIGLRMQNGERGMVTDFLPLYGPDVNAVEGKFYILEHLAWYTCKSSCCESLIWMIGGVGKEVQSSD